MSFWVVFGQRLILAAKILCITDRCARRVGLRGKFTPSANPQGIPAQGLNRYCFLFSCVLKPITQVFPKITRNTVGRFCRHVPHHSADGNSANLWQHWIKDSCPGIHHHQISSWQIKCRSVVIYGNDSLHSPKIIKDPYEPSSTDCGEFTLPGRKNLPLLVRIFVSHDFALCTALQILIAHPA